jgi:hypothetical protein
VWGFTVCRGKRGASSPTTGDRGSDENPAANRTLPDHPLGLKQVDRIGRVALAACQWWGLRSAIAGEKRIGCVSKGKQGVPTGGMEYSPTRKRRIAKRNRRQEARWRSKNGPVTITYAPGFTPPERGDA